MMSRDLPNLASLQIRYFFQFPYGVMSGDIRSEGKEGERGE